jgi:hypothetical protein
MTCPWCGKTTLHVLNECRMRPVRMDRREAGK